MWYTVQWLCDVGGDVMIRVQTPTQAQLSMGLKTGIVMVFPRIGDGRDGPLSVMAIKPLPQ